MSRAEELRMQRMSPAVRTSPAVQPRVNTSTLAGVQRASTPAPAPGNRPVSGVTADTAARLQQDYGYSSDQMRNRNVGLPTGAPANPPQQQSSSSSSSLSTSPTGNLNSVPSQSPGGGAAAPAEPAAPAVNVAALLDSEIQRLLEADFIGFQGDRANELRRLQNLRNQLFGDAETGLTGSVQRQQGLDEVSRRRLASQRAMSGMLQGGAYSGLQRGVGTIQRADQDFGIQEMKRPFMEQTQSDRLREFGLDFDSNGRQFNQIEYSGLAPKMRLNPETGQYEYDDTDSTGRYFSTDNFFGREASLRARNAAIERLAQRGTQI
jgi:hypothetical protein